MSFSLPAGAESALRDVRLGGSWTRAQAAKNGVIAWTIRAALFAADRLPASVLVALGRAIGVLARILLRRDRARAGRAAAACFAEPEASRIADACFERAGENLAMCLLLRRPSVSALSFVEVPDADHAILADALGAGRGVVFVSAHFGPFELLAAAVAELGHAPAIVVRESYDPRLDPLIDAHRLRRGIEVIHRGKKGAALRIARALRSGRPVGFLPDFGGRVPRVPARFLGVEGDFPIGPQHLARRLGSELVVGVLTPSDSRSTGRGRPFRLSIERVRVHEDGDSAGELTRRVASTLAGAITRTAESAEHFPWMAAPAPAPQRYDKPAKPAPARAPALRVAGPPLRAAAIKR